MCWVLYAASDLPFAYSPVPVSVDAPGIIVLPLDVSDEGVREKFSLPHAAYLSSNGCSCAIYDEIKDGEFSAARNGLSALLTDVLERKGAMELYLCWEGDQKTAVVSRHKLTPRSFMSRDFPLGEKQFANVILPPIHQHQLQSNPTS